MPFGHIGIGKRHSFPMPFFKITVDNIYLRRNMESYFINKFCPQLNRLH